ncbi:MAG: phage integrase N-terminal SAM-like domain-containing protein [Myxococcales bacterium]|nr:phage integrase N-terminal SAM-like domain-containing protein [Myxococcales bacterium]
MPAFGGCNVQLNETALSRGNTRATLRRDARRRASDIPSLTSFSFARRRSAVARSTETVMVTLETWQARMSEDMRLRDFRPRTQEAYLVATRQFMDRTQKEPPEITDEDVRRYFLYLREDKRLSPSSINIAVHALRFFFIRTLHRDWAVFDLLRVNKPRMLPVVLSTSEVRTVLGAV